MQPIPQLGDLGPMRNVPQYRVANDNLMSQLFGILYALRPLKQVVQMREKAFQAELKLAEAQRRWSQRTVAAHAPAYGMLCC